MINKVQNIPSIIKLDRNFRDTLKRFDDDLIGRVYSSPLLGHYCTDSSKMHFILLHSYMAREAIRKGTIGIFHARLKGSTRVVKLKSCVYIPQVRSAKEFGVLRGIEATSIHDFISKSKIKPLGVFDE